MSPPDGLRYIDQRVLIALGKLGKTRGKNPITTTDIADAAIVSQRTVFNALPRLIEAGFIIVNRRQGRPTTYDLTPQGWTIVEEYNGNKSTG
jgi:DNA-binding MarR family transcriptional regulator